MKGHGPAVDSEYSTRELNFPPCPYESVYFNVSVSIRKTTSLVDDRLTSSGLVVGTTKAQAFAISKYHFLDLISGGVFIGSYIYHTTTKDSGVVMSLATLIIDLDCGLKSTVN